MSSQWVHVPPRENVAGFSPATNYLDNDYDYKTYEHSTETTYENAS